MKTSTRLAISLFPLFSALFSQASAQTEGEATRFLSITTENDNYTPSRDDRHYTNGLRLAYNFSERDDSAWYSWLKNLVPMASKSKATEYQIAFGQNMYTPENFVTPLPQPNDRPFAGWLYGEIAVITHNPGIEQSLAISLGVVGPAALGEEAQKLIHDITDEPEPGGWDNQLDNEPALLLRYRRSWFQSLHKNDSISVDMVPRFSVNLGNVVTEAGVGAMFRLGSFLPEYDTPLRLQPGLSGNSTRFKARKGKTDWFIFAGAQGRVVGHNIFLDGNLDGDSLSVDKKNIVWNASTGLAVTFGQFKRPVFFSFSFVWQGKEFEQQREIDNFGSATISVGF